MRDDFSSRSSRQRRKEFSNELTKVNSVFQQVKPKIEEEDEKYCWSIRAYTIKTKFPNWRKKKTNNVLDLGDNKSKCANEICP